MTDPHGDLDAILASPDALLGTDEAPARKRKNPLPLILFATGTAMGSLGWALGSAPLLLLGELVLMAALAAVAILILLSERRAS